MSQNRLETAKLERKKELLNWLLIHVCKLNCFLNDRVQELERENSMMRDDLQRQQTKDSALVETLRLSLKSYEDALNAERKEHQLTK